nr:immunoglobulin light chain junction region [Macaca mulatta]MOX44233.1 immunoglobulin light chain junction region [Macaca mulatta]MOX45268.1 immunoglobulin light chain junction region [Macaca mulatta]MOX46093.1 immunoglobulin light chain junction region [Macaca mulatta]MOX47541.1 immunoglobulin light chain junction region [Macaca mulatta]
EYFCETWDTSLNGPLF